MLRAFAILALITCLSEATLSYLPWFAEGCGESCSGDSPDGHCPPACHECSCCAYRAPIPMPQVVISVQQQGLRESVAAYCEKLPPIPEPGEVLHVPKHVLA